MVLYCTMEIAKWKPQKVLALEYLIDNPTASQREVATYSGVTQGTISNWYKDPGFVETFYDRYMVVYNSKLPSVLDSMVNEAITGNVQAGRLVLEHSGKLQKNINVTISSPFENWLKEVKGIDVEDAEIIDDFGELPPRTADNSPLRAKEELNKLRNGVNKAKTNKKRAEQRKESRKWLKRAKAVGVDKLPARRPTPGQKKKWKDSIILKEKQASKSKKE